MTELEPGTKSEGLRYDQSFAAASAKLWGFSAYLTHVRFVVTIFATPTKKKMLKKKGSNMATPLQREFQANV